MNEGMNVMTNENNELIPTYSLIGLRIFMDYGKRNEATREDYFPILFIDQMLDRLAG